MKPYIIAGANGSGKTTFASSFSKFNNLTFINPDDLENEIIELKIILKSF